MKSPNLLDIDWLQMLAVFAAIGLGLLFIWSTSHNADGGVSLSVPLKQFVWAILGFICFLITMRIDYAIFERYAFVLFFGNLLVLLLILTTPLGAEINNSKAWIRFGPFSIQPSEFMKITLILAMAKYLRHEKNLHQLHKLIMPVMILLLPLGLILKQPDLGTAITLLPIFGSIMFVAGVRWRHMAMAFTAFVGMLPIMWFYVMNPYQQRRIEAFLDPEKYRVSEAYQLLQAIIAIGSGGWFGKGLGDGTQNRLNFLPVKESDFIFAVIAEEWGFFGILLLTAIFIIIGLAIASVASQTREPFGRLVCIGVLGWIMGQFFINCGVALGLLPTTGIPLLLVSQGGSALVSVFIALGIVTNIRVNRKPVIHSG